MNLLKIFKRKKIEQKKLWETDFEKFLEQAGEKELTEYTETLKEGREIDFTSQCWGHAFSTSKSIGEFAHFGHGFYGQILGSKDVTEGDYLLLKTGGDKIGKYLVLNVRYERDPRDMFWAYIVCIGLKE